MREHQPRSRPPRPYSPRNLAALRPYGTGIRKLERAAENRAYLHMLLLEKEPGFVAALELAMNLIDREMRDESLPDCYPADLRDRLDLAVRQAV